MDAKEEVSRSNIQEPKKTSTNMFKMNTSQKVEPSPPQSQPSHNRFKMGSGLNHLEHKPSLFSKDKKASPVLDVNNGEMFPSLDGDTCNFQPVRPKTVKQETTTYFDYKTIIVKRRPPPEPTDDIPVGWAKLYYDEYGQYVEDYKPTPGWRDPMPIERRIKQQQEIIDLFNERERNKRERIELFGEEGMYFQERDPYYTKDMLVSNDGPDSDGEDADAIYIENGYAKSNRKASNNYADDTY